MKMKIFTNLNIIFIVISIIMFFLTFDLYYTKVIYPRKINKEYEEKQKIEQQNIILELEEEQNETNKFVRDIPKTDEEKSKIYVGNYIACINKKEYNTAYSMLNENFKNTNFSTLDSYINYCKKNFDTYREMKILQYKKVDDILIVEVELTRLVEKEDNLDIITQYYTIKEKDDLGNFELSFGIGEANVKD